MNDSVHITAIPLPEGCRPTQRERDFTIATIAPPLVAAEEPAAATPRQQRRRPPRRMPRPGRPRPPPGRRSQGSAEGQK